jgi:hypothetical protein
MRNLPLGRAAAPPARGPGRVRAEHGPSLRVGVTVRSSSSTQSERQCLRARAFPAVLLVPVGGEPRPTPHTGSHDCHCTATPGVYCESSTVPCQAGPPITGMIRVTGATVIPSHCRTRSSRRRVPGPGPPPRPRPAVGGRGAGPTGTTRAVTGRASTVTGSSSRSRLHLNLKPSAIAYLK